MTVGTTITYRLALPFQRPPLTSNQREHWRHRQRWTYEIRKAVSWLARDAGIPPARHLTVGLEWAPGDRRRRDAENIVPTLKAACDALSRGRSDWLGLEMVKDDTPAYMSKLMPVILPPPHPPGLWLTVQIEQEVLS